MVSGLSKSYSAHPLFDDVTFTIGRREVVGLVGRNGSGKSTLFKIVLGFEEADSGAVSIPKGYRLGYLDQHINHTKETLLDECIQALPEDQIYDHYRAEKILFGLGFTQDDLTRAPSEFSGGYQLRINLCKCLLGQPDLLLLDEPTNYLDIVSLRWMRRFLKNYRGEVVLITHDRSFMDSVTTHTLGIHRGKVRKIEGQSGKYYEQLNSEEEIYEKTRVNKEKKLKQMQEFVDRFRAKASKATQAQSMVKKIEKMGVFSQLDTESVLGFRFNFKDFPAKRLMEVKQLSFGFQPDEILFSDLSFQIKPDDCIVVIGKNGKGKTTLLNVLAEQFKPVAGSAVKHPACELGYYQQTNRKDLNPNRTVAEEISHANPLLEISHVRGICGAMMFSGGDADKKIKVLSGGEQGRVLLGKVLAHPHNLLLLDEPSNHLDIESIEVLTEQIRLFQGAAIIVTHNEMMLRELATKLIIFHRDKAEVFNGSYDEFLEKIGWDDEEGGGGKKEKKNKKDDRKRRAETLTKRSKQLKPLTKEAAVIEKKIEDQEIQLAELNQLVLEAVQKEEQGQVLQDHYQKIGKIQIAVESLYSRLEKLTQQIEDLAKSE